MEIIQTFQIKSRYLKFEILICHCEYIFISFVWSFYCDIFTNIHATLLVFIVFIILILVTVQCCGNSFFNSIFFNGLKSGPGCSKAGWH